MVLIVAYLLMIIECVHFRGIICVKGKNCQRFAETCKNAIRHHPLSVHALLCSTAWGSTASALLPTSSNWQRNAARVPWTTTTKTNFAFTLNTCVVCYSHNYTIQRHDDACIYWACMLTAAVKHFYLLLFVTSLLMWIIEIVAWS